MNDGFAHYRSGAHNHVEYAGRTAGFLVDLGQQRGRSRRKLSRFENDAIPRRQRGCGFPHRDRPGKIPGRDETHHAERPANRVGESIARFRR